MNENKYKQILVNAFKELSEKYPDKWEPSTSKTCFSLSLPQDALYVCNYIDSNNLKNLSIYTIDNSGALRNNTSINEKEEAELYNLLMQYYEKIKQQVRTNKIENITS